MWNKNSRLFSPVPLTERTAGSVHHWCHPYLQLPLYDGAALHHWAHWLHRDSVRHRAHPADWKVHFLQPFEDIHLLLFVYWYNIYFYFKEFEVRPWNLKPFSLAVMNPAVPIKNFDSDTQHIYLQASLLNDWCVTLLNHANIKWTTRFRHWHIMKVIIYAWKSRTDRNSLHCSFYSHDFLHLMVACVPFLRDLKCSPSLS